jgi:hypothetical protein
MTATTTETIRPGADEHSAFYGKYVQRVPNGDLIAILREQIANSAALLRNAPSDRADFAYAPDKWTLKEVVGHMIDIERVMSYRALRFSRNDATPLAGFEENDWVANANFGERTLADLVRVRSGARGDGPFRQASRRRRPRASRHGERAERQRAGIVVHHRRA